MEYTIYRQKYIRKFEIVYTESYSLNTILIDINMEKEW